MSALLAAACGLVGLAIGSFLNVVAWRVPRGESVVSPPSHCPSCDHRLSPLENVPLLSWAALRARCRRCRAPISVRYPVVEAATGLLFAGLALRFGPVLQLPAYLYLAAVGIALAAIDLDVRRLPDVIVLPSYVVGLLALGVAAVGHHAGGDLLRAVEGMAVCFGGYFAIALVYPRGMGFGDVKLAGVLGLYLGFLGWYAVAVGMALGVVLGAVVSVALLALRRATRRTAIPYGPFMLAGALLAVFAGHPLAHAYLHVSGV